jgi:hypothetical protein
MVMEIEELNKEDLIFITQLMRDGVSYDEAVANIIPIKTRDNVNSLHSLVCKKKHDKSDIDFCNYYSEYNWINPYHAEWVVIYNDLLKSCNSDKPDTLEDIFYGVVTYMWKIESMREEIEDKLGEQGVKLFTQLVKLLFRNF